jgi:hypothetical protein
MAVKVMVATAIAKREVSESEQGHEVLDGPRPSAPAAKEHAKPKRRKSAVYDADGHEVFITLMCLKCHKMKPLSQFGLRKMADGAIRNQPWCRPCRSGAGVEKPRAGAQGAAVSTGSVETAETTSSQVEPPVSDARPASSNLAAQIAAALHAGRG